ncbi:hypothetical protein LDL_057 [Lactobacillus phage Ldl1]|uniref:DUF7336 domain-containing protein n=1 Tax=Lactobacillus phage Ldl1 TaxID=1552735 RepID=A0A0A7DN27_9CAUD|nr:hypothetical protein VC66_gp57 [Lactobacillus phage Ldl1]AIS73915.1 hypothetical protein LDL_057 [Lactobacillus phage Ldl1]
MTVYVLYTVVESNVEIKGVFQTKERAEEKRKQIRESLVKLGSRHFVSVLIDECEMGL